MDFVDVALLLLAGARLTILIVYDDIMEPVRDVIFRLSPPENDATKGHYYQNFWPTTKRERANYKRSGMGWWQRRWAFHSEENRPVGFVGSAISCPDCAGVWVGLALAFSYFTFKEETIIVSVVLSVSMATSWIVRKGRFR